MAEGECEQGGASDVRETRGSGRKAKETTEGERDVGERSGAEETRVEQDSGGGKGKGAYMGQVWSKGGRGIKGGEVWSNVEGGS